MTPPTIRLQFGDYVFGGTFAPAGVPGDARLPMVEIPRRDGVALSRGTVAEKRIVVRGMLIGDDEADLRSRLDALVAGVSRGRQKLFLHTDRYIWATKTSLSTDYDETSLNRYAHVSVEFLADDPFWESVTQSQDIWAVNGAGGPATRGLATIGTARTPPVFRLSFSGAGTADLKLSTAGAAFTLKGAVGAADEIVVDCRAQTVTLAADASDKMSLFDGIFPVLPAGASLLTQTRMSGTVAFNTIVTQWSDRWL